MSSPNVTITERDGAIGVLPAGQRIAAFVGPALGGPLNSPASFARKQDIAALFVGGPTVELAARYIEVYRKPCLFMRSGNGVAGAVSAVDSVATGTSVVTTVASPTPKDDLEVVLTFMSDGTRGTDGTYQISLDNDRTPGVTKSLGAATTLAVPEAGFSFAFAAGTFEAGDKHRVIVTAPNATPGEIDTALDALRVSAVNWEACLFGGPLTATAVGHVETKFAALFAAGKYCYWMGSWRLPALDELESEYLTAFAAEMGGTSVKYGGVCAGAEKIASAVSGLTSRRPVIFAAGPLQASVSEEVNIADPNLGAIPGVLIRDSNGNPDEHDETISPGLDDARAITLRTFEDEPGVFINRARLFSAPGSDFQLMLHRRVLNLGHIALRKYFQRRLNSPILVDAETGFILEKEALEIETHARAAMRSLLLAKPKASAIDFTLSRNDNLLATKTLTGQGRVTPLGYPEFIELEVSFFNPVNAVAA